MRIMNRFLILALMISSTPALAQGTADQYYAAGNQFYSSGDYGKAVLYYQAAIQLNPNQAESHQGLGSAFFAQGNKKAALQEYEKSLQLNQDNQALMEFISKNFKEFGERYDIESKAYVDRVVPAICKIWDQKALRDESSPELAEELGKNQDKINQLFYTFKKRLGSLIRYNGSNGESTINFSKTGKTVTCEYNCQADFELGKASIHIRAVCRDERWKLLLIEVNSDNFLKDL